VDRLRVLIIDDSITIRAMLEELLEREPDCRIVGIAGDVDSARELIEQQRPNVITLDLAMPGVEGLHFLDELKAKTLAAIVVLSSSAREGAPIIAEALAHGAVACFDKAKLLSEARRFVGMLKHAVKPKVSHEHPRAGVG
jgi:chemotaxis response regulator CheB